MRKPTRPSGTEEYSSSRLCVWGGPASVPGRNGCSMLDRAPPVASVETLKAMPNPPSVSAPLVRAGCQYCRYALIHHESSQ